MEKKKGLPNITILHTGGTIASKVDYRTGAVFASFKPEDLIGMFPELSEIANFDSKLVASMFSEDMRFKLYSLMAKEIEKEAGSEGVERKKMEWASASPGSVVRRLFSGRFPRTAAPVE